jgi:hypothetical protein
MAVEDAAPRAPHVQTSSMLEDTLPLVLIAPLQREVGLGTHVAAGKGDALTSTLAIEIHADVTG